jgi:prepilin-type N-terminal cleavage/methylation domain-containing protein
LKKAFTLIELTVGISIILILVSSANLAYKYYIRHSRDRAISFFSEEIFEAVIYLYEDRGNSLDDRDLLQGVKELTNNDLSVRKINMDDKLIYLIFCCQQREYLMKIDLKNCSFTVIEMVGDRIIYEN